MIFDGRAFARERLRVLQEARKEFGPLSIGIVVSSSDPVTSSYVKIKERNAQALDIGLVRYVVPDHATLRETLDAVAAASTHDGVIVQLPLPPDIPADEVLDAMPPEKDLDVISTSASERFAGGRHPIMPPVASALNEIIDAHNIMVQGKKVVIVGKGKLVGLPAYHLMRFRGAQVVSLDHDDALAPAVKDADILVLGAGSPHLVTPDMVKEGVVVFDAGTSESGGVVVGDADPRISEKASFFTPVPGGIGPVAVVEIFANLLTLVGSHAGSR